MEHFGERPAVTPEGKPREPLQFWGCGENHKLKDCPRRKEKRRGLHNLDSVAIVEDMARATSKIYAALEDQQANHQSTMIKVEGKIAKQSISILIDPGSTHSYVTPKIVENCRLIKKKHDRSWLVQLVTGTKRKVCELVPNCP